MQVGHGEVLNKGKLKKVNQPKQKMNITIATKKKEIKPKKTPKNRKRKPKQTGKKIKQN